MKASSWWLALVLVACAPTTPAEHAVATQSLAGYEYISFVTGNAKPSAPLPLIIGLHYSSARPETIVGDFDRIDVPARIVLPRGKYPRRGGYSWFPSNYGELNPAEQAKVTIQIKDELVGFIDAVTKAYPTNGKPSLIGTSYGGDLSYLIAIHHPDRVSAAFPVAARFPTEWMPTINSCRPTCPRVYAMHGDKDPIVPIDGGRRAARELAGMGFRVELHEYAGVGHDFTEQMKGDFTAAVRNTIGP